MFSFRPKKLTKRTPMHLKKLLHKTFENTANNIDKRNHKTLIEAAVTLSECKHLSIAVLGRNLKSNSMVKHSIKRIDRLFGNKNVQSSAIYYYHQIAKLVIKDVERPSISIDWSGLTPCGEFHLLRASCPVKGRAVTVFEQSYRESEYMKQSVHKTFIKKLKFILPESCRPIIVTDAGFRCPWFKLVTSLGWDYVGRVRNNTQYLEPVKQQWLPIKTLYSQATVKPNYLFSTSLAKANSVRGGFYIVKSKPKNRKRKNLRGKKIQCSSSLKHAKRGGEPWLLFSSLSTAQFNAQKITKIYVQRMQIEESFRDLKNTNNGLSLRHCRSYQKGRLNIALLIAAITHFLLWLVGLVAKQKNLHFSFQANTIKHRNVLSTFSVGWQYIRRYGNNINFVNFKLALKQLNQDFMECQ